MFNKLVISQKILKENEFWQFNHSTLSSKPPLTDFQFSQKFTDQTPGFQSAPMFLRSSHDIKTGEEDLEIS